MVHCQGTEYFDGKLKRYVDFPITDVLQMMGRAGRPQFDTHAIACIMVHEPKKNFYRKFLYEPFPVESQLKGCLHDHINAEIAGGTIKSVADGIDYLTWTYFFRRLLINPSYYGLDSTDPEAVNAYLVDLIDVTFQDLADAGCIEMSSGAAASDDEEGGVGASKAPLALINKAWKNVSPTPLGQIASFYYLSYRTVGLFSEAIGPRDDIRDLCKLVADAAEFDELPGTCSEWRLWIRRGSGGHGVTEGGVVWALEKMCCPCTGRR